MSGWLQRDIVDAGKLPLVLCLAAFVVTFLTTRTITRMIRARVGPFRRRFSSGGFSAGGLHVHHAVPGIVLLIVGAFTALAASGEDPWIDVAALVIGAGTSLVLDEFALILHLEDVYWEDEGRISVEMVGLTVACLGLVIVGVSPFGVGQVGTVELGLRLGAGAVAVLHGLIVMVCVAKGKYRLALFGLFVAVAAWAGAFRLARPGSAWARHRYGPEQEARAAERAKAWDARVDPWWDRLSDLVAGRPSDDGTGGGTHDGGVPGAPDRPAAKGRPPRG